MVVTTLAFLYGHIRTYLGGEFCSLHFQLVVHSSRVLQKRAYTCTQWHHLPWISVVPNDQLPLSSCTSVDMPLAQVHVFPLKQIFPPSQPHVFTICNLLQWQRADKTWEWSPEVSLTCSEAASCCWRCRTLQSILLAYCCVCVCVCSCSYPWNQSAFLEWAIPFSFCPLTDCYIWYCPHTNNAISFYSIILLMGDSLGMRLTIHCSYYTYNMMAVIAR